MDLYESKSVKPMLIGAEGEPFDSDEYLYELKLDGERCVAFLDVTGTELFNKRGMKMLPKVPELSDIHAHISKRCILDGELIVIKDGKPSFPDIQRRSLMSNSMKIEIAAKQYPATFVSFDILYCDDHSVMQLPLWERKALLKSIVKDESPHFAVSRVVEKDGKAFFALAKEQELEGIVAKRRDSLYYPGKRTKDWIKIKYMQDDDFVVLGYIPKRNGMTCIILGQYSGGSLVYKGHVTLGVSGEAFGKISNTPKSEGPVCEIPDGNENAVWIRPTQVCKVKYMTRTAKGGMRQPVFAGLREDKRPEECRETIRCKG